MPGYGNTEMTGANEFMFYTKEKRKEGRKEKVPVIQCHRRHNKISNSEAGRPAKSLERSPRRTGRTGYVGAPGGE